MTKTLFAADRTPQADIHYIFDLAETVVREQVYYPTRYGVEIAADLYYAKDLDKTTSSPALVVGPPFGGVKEQGPGVYANEMAQRGFVVLAFDPAYHGYSGGQPRYVGSPDTYLEDFSAAVDFLGTLDFVNRDQIGAIGICASGGFSLGATAQDARIKAVATSVMYDIPSLAGLATGQERAEQVAALSQQRWDDFGKESSAFDYNYPEAPLDQVPADLPPVPTEFLSFYATKRGWHEHARANITATSNLSFMNFQATARIDEISPRPVLLVTSEEAHSKDFSLATFDRLKEPKELYVLEKGQHVDFYDRTDTIPFDKLEDFFKKAFN
ncbi:alpha/beta hydrolase [Streptococcus loxodontisalivarius]|uniref:Fermentation-respiration switch protein FrsA (DUF1100 family) n=1 Tax=Streptococcus loxodontisalivarius TaxID=1349415 RepID=A0ABS2PT03_9STRE|nr:alpha/beta hydrolase [Streptococcus loxodontisalivarius]MBM7642675.1 fermentation-respiration switch protein FrsA (DUF1100 family) [Streptococcus loxodontisalivarius]